MNQDTLKVLLQETVAEMVEEKLQALLELDRWAFLREHGGRANGHYPRKLETAFGEVELEVPRDREGRYTPSFLPRYTRRTPDLADLVLALYAGGVSDRKVARIVNSRAPIGIPLQPRDGRQPDGGQQPDRAGAGGGGRLSQEAPAPTSLCRLPGRPLPQAAIPPAGASRSRPSTPLWV